MDGSTGGDGGNEVQANAKFLEQDGDRSADAPGDSLHHWVWIFTAGEKARLLAVGCQHVWLCQHLHQPLGLQGCDGGAKIQVGAEEEEVQRIRYRRYRALLCRVRHRRYRKLSRADGADGVGRTQTEEIEAELFGQGPVNTGEAYLQKNLRVGGGNIDVQQVDHLARGGRDLHGAIGAGEILNIAAKEDLAILEAYLHLLFGKLCFELAAERLHTIVGCCGAGADDHVKKLTTTACFP